MRHQDNTSARNHIYLNRKLSRKRDVWELKHTVTKSWAQITAERVKLKMKHGNVSEGVIGWCKNQRKHHRTMDFFQEDTSNIKNI